MSWISDLITSAISVGQQAWQNHFNKKEAEKNRDFQSSEAEVNRAFQSNEAALQRDWSAAEAERARDWQEEMYAKYNSLSGKIAQAEQAGVNPMFAVTGGAVSPMSPSGNVPSGSAAGSVGTPSGSAASAGAFVDIIGNLMQVKKAQAEIDVDNALAEKYRNEATGQSITNETLRELNVTQIIEARSRIEYNDENTKLITSKILNTDADTLKKSHELGQIASSIASMDADTEVKRKQIEVMCSQIRLNDSEILRNSKLNEKDTQDILNLSVQFERLVQEKDFFDKVKQYRENIEKASSDNASLREKLSSLSPLISLPYDVDLFERSKVYRNRFESSVENYISVLKSIADSI